MWRSARERHILRMVKGEGGGEWWAGWYLQCGGEWGKQMSRSLPHSLLIWNLHSFHPAAFVRKVSLQKKEEKKTRQGSITNSCRRCQGWGFEKMNIFHSLFSWPFQVDECVTQGDVIVQAVYSQPWYCSSKSSFLQQRCLFFCYFRGVYSPI